MLQRIKAFVSKRNTGTAPDGDSRAFDRVHLATAALLVEAALMDDDFEAGERATILVLLTGRFGLSAQDSEDLLEAAEDKVAKANDLYAFTKTVKDEFSNQERIGMLEMLWEVSYSDGVLHDYEASLIRRVTGLLHVSDRDSGAARKRALDKLARESAAKGDRSQ